MKRRVIAIVALIVAANLILIATDAFIDTEEVAGPAGSSYVTTGEGVAAWYELLDRTGRPVSRSRVPLARLDPSTTVVVLEPLPQRIDETALREMGDFVQAGGRLVVGGVFPEWVREIVGNDLTWTPSPIGLTHSIDPAPETGHVDSVAFSSLGAWDTLPNGATVLTADDDGRVSSASLDMGAGRIILIANTTALMNAYIGTADNAAFAIGITGDDDRPVVFSEFVHDFTDEGGLTALPDSWIWAIALGLLALLTYLVAIGRRLGPPEEPDRVFPPARREYLDALGGSLAKTRQPETATSPIRAEARRLIAERTGLGPNASTDDLIGAARLLNLNDDEISSIISTSHDEEALLRSGEVLADLMGRTTGQPT